MRKTDAIAVKVGQRLRELRKAKGWTQVELAEKADLNAKFLGELENGRRDVRLTTISRLAKALKVEAAQLLTFSTADVTISDIQAMIRSRDEAFRAHLVRVVREMLLLVDSAT